MLTGHLRPNRCSTRQERLPLLRCLILEAVIPQWFSVQRFLYTKHYTFWITKSTFVENKLHKTQLKEYKLCISLGLGLKNSRNSVFLLCFHQYPVALIHTEKSLTLHSKYTSQFEYESSKALLKIQIDIKEDKHFSISVEYNGDKEDSTGIHLMFYFVFSFRLFVLINFFFFFLLHNEITRYAGMYFFSDLEFACHFRILDGVFPDDCIP